MKRLLDYDKETGTKTFHDYDHNTGLATISTETDVSPILTNNKDMYNDPSYKQQGMKNDMLHVARIPMELIAKWKFEDNIDVFNNADKKKVMRKLNDPAYRYLRTASGRY